MSVSESTRLQGILSVIDVANILSVSLPTVRRYFDANRFPGGYKMNDSSERRIPAPSVVQFCKDNGMLVPLTLKKHVEAYKVAFGSLPKGCKNWE